MTTTLEWTHRAERITNTDILPLC